MKKSIAGKNTRDGVVYWTPPQSNTTLENCSFTV